MSSSDKQNEIDRDKRRTPWWWINRKNSSYIWFDEASEIDPHWFNTLLNRRNITKTDNENIVHKPDSAKDPQNRQ